MFNAQCTSSWFNSIAQSCSLLSAQCSVLTPSSWHSVARQCHWCCHRSVLLDVDGAIIVQWGKRYITVYWDTIMYTVVRWDHHSPVRHNEVQWSTVKYSEQKRFSEIQVQSCVVCLVQYVHCSLSLSIWIDPDQAMPSIGNQYHWADQTNIDSTLLRENKTVCFCAIHRLNQYLGVRRIICVHSEAFYVASMWNTIKIFSRPTLFERWGFERCLDKSHLATLLL